MDSTMLDICNQKPALPREAINGDEICDRHGNKWVYDQKSNSWISRGTISTYGLVTEDSDGLATPVIYQRLRELEAYTQSSPKVRQLKILPGKDAYWYYFRSSDKSFRFRPESESALRIEVDRGRIFQILMKEICPGARGLKGKQGERGPDGIQGSPELCYEPIITNGDRLDFAIFTPAPLSSGGPIPIIDVPPISVRIYRVIGVTTSSNVNQLDHLAVYFYNNDPRNEILPKFQTTRDLLLRRTVGDATTNLCNIPLSPIAIDVETEEDPVVILEINPEDPTKITVEAIVDIDEQRTLPTVKYDPATGIVCGSIYAIGEWLDVANHLCVRSRQKGPDGDPGDPGECRVRVVECDLDNTSVRAVCPLVHVRLDCEQETIFTLCSDLLNEVCVERIRLVPNSGTLANVSVFKSTFAAAEMTLDECKRINRYQVSLEEDEIPELNLLHWDPQPGCFTRRHYDRHKFEWIPDTDIPACDARGTWYGPSNVRPGKYPHELVTAPKPSDDLCCEDDFFYCPNVQQPCATSPSSAASSAATGHIVEIGDKVEPSLRMGTKDWNQRT